MSFYYKHKNKTDYVIINDDNTHSFIGKEANDLMFKIDKLLRDNNIPNTPINFDDALKLYLKKCSFRHKIWENVTEEVYTNDPTI